MSIDQPPDRATKPRVALVFGGRSSEHAISCVTAGSVLRAIDRDKYDVVPIGISREGHWVLAADDAARFEIRDGVLPEIAEDDGPRAIMPLGGGPQELLVTEPSCPPREFGTVDVVFPLLHGPFGEDGTLQGLFELSDIRYVGSGVLASAVMMDKHLMKVVFAAAGLPIGRYVAITDRRWLTQQQQVLREVETLGFPVFVKPARAGSSMGISRVSSADGLPAAIEDARRHDPKVVVEAAVVGREIECGVLQGRGMDAPRTSVVGEITVSGHDFYDFSAKYLDDAHTHLTVPADVPAEVTARVQELAVVAFEAAGCEGLARVDCWLTDDGTVLVNEINTMPGFTPFSMFPQVWAASGLSYPDLIDELVQLALHRPVGLR